MMTSFDCLNTLHSSCQGCNCHCHSLAFGSYDSNPNLDLSELHRHTGPQEIEWTQLFKLQQ